MPDIADEWASLTAHNHPNPRKWSMDDIRSLVQEKLGKRPCLMQMQVAREIRAGKDVIACARTGAGKTLSFWIALLMDMDEGGDKMIFVVSPLTLLGRQNTDSLDLLQDAGLTSIAVSAENANPRTFKEILAGKYRVITVSPEIIMTHPEVQSLWKNPAFTKKLQYFVFDEGHCISQWAKFREQYAKLGDLRYLIPDSHVPFYVASATLPEALLRDVEKALHLRPQKTRYIMKSNDRPEISLMVRGMAHPAYSFHDLDFLIPDGYSEADGPLPLFVVFFDDTQEAQNACRHLQKRLPEAFDA